MTGIINNETENRVRVAILSIGSSADRIAEKISGRPSETQKDIEYFMYSSDRGETMNFISLKDRKIETLEEVLKNRDVAIIISEVGNSAESAAVSRCSEIIDSLNGEKASGGCRLKLGFFEKPPEKSEGFNAFFICPESSIEISYEEWCRRGIEGIILQLDGGSGMIGLDFADVYGVFGRMGEGRFLTFDIKNYTPGQSTADIEAAVKNAAGKIPADFRNIMFGIEGNDMSMDDMYAVLETLQSSCAEDAMIIFSGSVSTELLNTMRVKIYAGR